MNVPALVRSVDWSRYRLTRLRVIAICAAMLALELGVSFAQFSQARDNVLPGGAVIGGDYVAFHVAAKAAHDGEAASVYDTAAFERRLREWGPQKERYGLTWQYPPTYFFAVAPLAELGFIPGYVLWTGLAALGFFAALRSAGLGALFLFVILASPAVFQAAITGQNGFLTAALLIIAALYPDKRPIAAGLAAALLTMKPQLGALLPVAYLAGGCWRAFLTAALGAGALAAASWAAFGAESWIAFADHGLRAAGGNLSSGLFPLFKMGTPFSALRLAGANAAAAYAGAALFAFGALALVALVWRRVEDRELKAALLLSCVFFATPYGYYYEFVILALPAAIVARRGLEKGFLAYEQAALALAFALPLFVTSSGRETPVSLGFITVLIIAASVIRRIAHERPELLDPSRPVQATGRRQAPSAPAAAEQTG